MRLRSLIEEMRELMEVTFSGSVGSYVRPSGPMLPPAPSPGYDDAADILDPPKRKQLDSRPRKKRRSR